MSSTRHGTWFRATPVLPQSTGQRRERLCVRTDGRRASTAYTRRQSSACGRALRSWPMVSHRISPESADISADPESRPLAEQETASGVLALLERIGSVVVPIAVALYAVLY